MDRDLRILNWNANGLMQHQEDLQAVLDIEKIDVCLISETHFTNQSFIKFRNFTTYHTFHPVNTAKGGSAVIIRNSIQHHEALKYITEEIQATAVNIKTNNYSFNVVAIYCPPKHPLKEEDYLKLLRKLGNRFIIGGDFNAKHVHWGSRLTSTKGKELFNATRICGCEALSTGKPTYWPTDPNKIPDLIDFFIIKNISANYLQIDEFNDLNSDHSPILLTMSENIIQKQSRPTLTTKHTDWESFKRTLEDRIELNVAMCNSEQLEREVEKFVNDIQQSAWINTPETRRKIKGNNYPREIRELIADRRRARRRWQQTRDPQDKSILNNLTQQLRREIKILKEDSIKDYLRGLTNEKTTDYSLWKAMKKIKRPIMQIPPIRTIEGKWAKTNKHKAEIFAEYLKNVFQPHSEQEIYIPVETAEEESEEIRLTTPREVRNEIKNNINPKKCPGYDLITGEILRQLPKKAVTKLTNLINAAFRMQYVPSLWKVAEVIMISKPGKPPNETSSYRPISILPVISKLFEKLLVKRLNQIIERKNLIPNYQFGFRKHHSTVDQVHRIINIIEKALEGKKVCSAVFLDVAQAFDKVWHEGLNHKLRCLLPKQYAAVLESYLSGRFFRIKQEDSYSELTEIKAGVPQGSVLGPILYLLYTGDLPELENSTLATFADDTAILAVGKDNVESTQKLQCAVNKIFDWTIKWRMKLNESKSVHINFTNRRINHIPVTINQNEVPYANTAKYLGMTLDAKLRWKEHVKKKKTESEIKYRKMYWLIGKDSPLSIYNKLLLYKQSLKPIWTYGIQLWGCTKKSNADIVQRFQNKVLRNIVNAPWYIRNNDLHRDLGVESVVDEIRKNARRHESRLQQHTNTEIVQILDNTNIVRRLKRTKPFELVSVY